MKAVKVLAFGVLTLLLAACEPGGEVDISTDPQALEVGQGSSAKTYIYRVTHTSGSPVTADLKTSGDFILGGGSSDCNPGVVQVSADSPDFSGNFSVVVPEDMQPDDYVLTISLMPTGGGAALASTDVGIKVIEFLTLDFVPGEGPRWDPEGYFRATVGVKSDVDASIGLTCLARAVTSGDLVGTMIAQPPTYNISEGETVTHPFSIKYTEAAAGEQYQIRVVATGHAAGVVSRKDVTNVFTIPGP